MKRFWVGMNWALASSLIFAATHTTQTNGIGFTELPLVSRILQRRIGEMRRLRHAVDQAEDLADVRRATGDGLFARFFDSVEARAGLRLTEDASVANVERFFRAAMTSAGPDNPAYREYAELPLRMVSREIDRQRFFQSLPGRVDGELLNHFTALLEETALASTLGRASDSSSLAGFRDVPTRYAALYEAFLPRFSRLDREALERYLLERVGQVEQTDFMPVMTQLTARNHSSRLTETAPALARAYPFQLEHSLSHLVGVGESAASTRFRVTDTEWGGVRQLWMTQPTVTGDEIRFRLTGDNLAPSEQIEIMFNLPSSSEPMVRTLLAFAARDLSDARSLRMSGVEEIADYGDDVLAHINPLGARVSRPGDEHFSLYVPIGERGERLGPAAQLINRFRHHWDNLLEGGRLSP
jgi:hypothetical protein